MVTSPDDATPLTKQSPSITQETKARFNQLLNAALKESSREQGGLTRSTGSTPKKHLRSGDSLLTKNRTVRTSEDEFGDIISTGIYSSEESSASRTINRQVIAEVHSSQSRLLASSSEEDMLAEKKTKKKRKKSKSKQVLLETKQHVSEEGQVNVGYQTNEDLPDRSSSKLSNRSYTLETSTVPKEKLLSLQNPKEAFCDEVLKSQNPSPSRISNRSYTLESPSFPMEEIRLPTKRRLFNESLTSPKLKSDSSPSRLSNRSYTLESPTVLTHSYKKDDVIVSKTDSPVPQIRPPVPLPRKKSLKSAFSPEREVFTLVPLEKEPDVQKSKPDTVITIRDSISQETEEDLETSRSAAVKLQASFYTHTEEEEGDIPLSVRKQKRKKRRRKRSKSRERVELQALTGQGKADLGEYHETKLTHSTITEDSRQDVSAPAEEQIVGVTIHGMDCALVDLLVRHPVVKLYIVDMSTGEYFNKSDPSRAVCYFSENTGYIQPIMSHPYDFRKHRSVVPQWEECLLLNENLTHLITESTLLLFELCDFLTAPVASARYDRLVVGAAWHVVAWAFLKPMSACGSLNLSTRLRLQLFKPGKQPKTLHPRTPSVYEWWGSSSRHKYAGCLYVTVSAVDPPASPMQPGLRSRTALQAEESSVASARSTDPHLTEDTSDTHDQTREDTKPETVMWSRLAVQSCKIPNSQLSSLPVDGSMCLRFSPDGLWLACASQHVYIYSVIESQLTTTLSNHQGLIYCVEWHRDSKVLLSASADCTVCVWRPFSRNNPLLQMLAHPSFVYSAQFLYVPGYCSVVTACYDSLVRLWQGETHSTYQLTQQLSGHSGYVTSVCVTTANCRVISADSQGSLRIYNVEDASLTVGLELRVRELRGVVINNVLIHPGGHRIVVHSRDSMLRSVDLATGAVLQVFKGCTNTRLQTSACVSACGSLLFACGEDGAVLVWDCHTGVLRAVYCSQLPPGSASIHYHPHDHILALGSLEQPPVFLLTYHQNASGEDVGLNMVKKGISVTDVIEKMKAIHNSNRWQRALYKVIATAQVRDKSASKHKKKRKGVEKHEEEASEKQSPTSHSHWSSLPRLDYLVEKTNSESKDLRLLEILKKMDSMILAAKQSSQ